MGGEKLELTNMLHSAGDVDVVRASLISIKHSLNVAATDYAQASLGAAQEAYDAALAASPCSIVWSHLHEYQKFHKKAKEALDACSTSVALLLQVEETGNTSIDGVNARVKVDSMDKHVIYSMLEGANTRAQVAVNTMPENPVPGALCIPSKVIPNGDSS